MVDAGLVPLQGAPVGEGAHEAVGGGEGQPGPPADVREGQRGVLVVEGAEHGQQPVGRGAGGHGRAAPGGVEGWVRATSYGRGYSVGRYVT